VEIDAATKKVRIRRVVQAWDCGAIVNPDGLRNQLRAPLFRASVAHSSRESSLPMAAF
jgi:isoquinoline 1-oxidoreductase